MFKPKFLPYLAVLGVGASVLPANLNAATVSLGLQAKLDALPRPAKAARGTAAEAAPAATVLTIITFNTGSGLAGVANLDTPVTGLLTANGIVPLSRFELLGMVTANLTAAQVNALKTDSRVRSLYDNYKLRYSLSQARVLCGVDRLRNDAAFTAANGGNIVDGAGTTTATTTATGTSYKPQFSIVVIDSGLSTSGGSVSQPDLSYDATSMGVLNNQSPPTGYSIAPNIPNTKVIQNIQVTSAGGPGASSYVENRTENDSVGHGSHCAGIVGGLGTFSKMTPATTGFNGNPNSSMVGQPQDFSGAASGARVIGCGSGAAVFVLDAVGGFNYAVNFQAFYNVRVTSNSYGSNGPFDPADPLNVAIKAAYDRNITNVFAAGNDGPGVDTISNSSKSPYVITVAAGTKEGGLVGFSSRGKPASERTNNPALDAFNLPAITAPGTGREFEYNAPAAATVADPDNVPGKHFTTDIISTRSKIPGAAAGMNDQELPAPYVGVYTQISGTSMACPFVAGAVGLLLDVDDTLTPDSAHPAASGRKGMKEILQATATHMPDYKDHEVGAGYLNAYAAVDLAFNQGRGYLPFNRVDAPYASSYTPFQVQLNTSPLAPPGTRPIQGAGQPAPGSVYPPATVNNGPTVENYTIPYRPQSVNASTYEGAKTKAGTGDNAYAFLVDADVNGVPNVTSPGQRTTTLDVRITLGQTAASGVQDGNTIGLLLYAPDGTQYSSGIALPVLDNPNRQVLVPSPMPGLWVAELRGLRGLAAVPFTPPTGVGVPGTTTGQIFRTNSQVSGSPTDIVDSPFRDQINNALLNRYLDVVSAGLFQPKVRVTRGEIAQVFADNLPVRQTLTGANPFTDVSGNLARVAQAITVNGSTLRDWNYAPAGLLATKPTQFRPSFFVTRIEIATALVRALGIDMEAQRLNPTAITVVSNGVTYPVVDPGEITAAARGYLQLALDRGILDFTLRNGTVNGATQTVAYVRPAKEITREELAGAIVNFRTAFRRGN